MGEGVKGREGRVWGEIDLNFTDKGVSWTTHSHSAMTNEEFQKLVLDQLSLLNNSVQRVEKRMDGLEERMGGLEGRMDGLETEVKQLRGEMEERFEQLEGRMDRLEQRMDHLETGVKQLRVDMETGFAETKQLMVDIFGSPVAEGVELYTDRMIREHEEKHHSEAVGV